MLLALVHPFALMSVVGVVDGQKTAIMSPGESVAKERGKKKTASPAKPAKSSGNMPAKSSTDSGQIFC